MGPWLAALAAIVGCLLLAVGALAVISWFSASQLMERRTPDPPADPAQLGLSYEPVAFLASDGLRLGGWHIPGREPIRGMVILCHGHAGSLDSDLRYAPAFHQHGFDVLQFDFRAHGRSQGQEVSMGYYERLDLLAAVAWAQERGFERVGILGFSMGGAVAISTAAQCLGIAAVASDSGFARLQPTLQAGLQQRGLPNWLAKLVTPWMMRMAGWRLHCRLDEADPLRWVHKISPRPVLFIHGGRDRYVDRTEIEALHASAGNPKALWFVQEAEHRRIDRVRPEEYQARVLGFFERWLAEGGQGESVATR